MATLRFVTNGPSDKRVFVDDTEISSIVQGVSIRAYVDGLPHVELDLSTYELEAESTFGENVQVSGLTRQTLLHLGWTPPQPKPENPEDGVPAKVGA